MLLAIRHCAKSSSWKELDVYPRDRYWMTTKISAARYGMPVAKLARILDMMENTKSSQRSIHGNQSLSK